MSRGPTRLERLEREGSRRLGSPARGFRWRTARGTPVSAAERRRLEALRIPPAWTDVVASPSPHARVLAMGRDRAGRWQYLYHPDQAARRERDKSERLRRFLRALPALRRRVARDLARPGLPREKVMACIVRILSTCFLRPGSEVYAAENGSYGIATLRARHVTVKGGAVRFDFPGKQGRRQVRELRDRVVARVVRELKRMPGRDVFKYRAEDGSIVDVRRRGINAYLREITGERFTAKDFRTWAGSLLCASALAAEGFHRDDPPAGRRRRIARAVRATAERLGNTPAICRASYIEPRVLARYLEGRTLECPPVPLDALAGHRNGRIAERALARLLNGRSTPRTRGASATTRRAGRASPRHSLARGARAAAPPA